MTTASTVAAQVQTLTREFEDRTAHGSPRWVFSVADRTTDDGLDLPVLYRTLSALTWAAREAGQRMPTDADHAAAGDDPRRRLAMMYLHAARLRADFRFETLSRLAREWLTVFPDDTFLLAHSGFGALGARSPGAIQLVERTLAAAETHSDPTVRHVCLQALWFADQLPDQAERILALSDDMIGRGEDEANLYYWRAHALRRADRLEEALTSVDRAIELLPPTLTSVHQDFVRERQLITATALLRVEFLQIEAGTRDAVAAEMREEMTRARSEFLEQSKLAQQLVSDSLLKLIEVLGLFVTLAGFLVGSGAIALRVTDFWQALGSLALALVGSLTFFLLLRLTLRFRR